MDDFPPFDELVDTLLERLYDADALNLSDGHSFRELMKDQADVIADGWYWRAYDELAMSSSPKASSTSRPPHASTVAMPMVGFRPMGRDTCATAEAADFCPNRCPTDVTSPDPRAPGMA